MFELKITFKTLEELRNFVPFVGAAKIVDETEIPEAESPSKGERLMAQRAEAEAQDEPNEKPAPKKAPKKPSPKQAAHAKLQAKQADPTAAPADTTPAAATPPASAAPSANEPPSKRDIEVALRKFVAEKGMPAAREVLAEFKLTRVADLQPAQFAAFYARLTK